jgi:hypothetical protein
MSILDRFADPWRRLSFLREADYSLSNHETVGGRMQNGWIKMGGSQDEELSVDRYDQMEEAYKAYRFDPIAKNIVEIYASYILGDGYSVKFDNEDDKERWESFREENTFDDKFQNAVRLLLVRGEHFFWLFENDNWYSTPQIRHLPATQVGDIDTAAGDPEKVTMYHGRADYYEKSWNPEKLIHLKIFSYGQMRGHGILEPILSPLAKYRKFLNAQAVSAQIVASLPIIRKGPWTTEQITSRINDFAALPPPGTVITTGNKEEWGSVDHAAARVNWRDQGRALALAIASGAGLPYFMVFCDSSDSNYSATLVAEAPAIRRFNDIRLSMQGALRELVKRVVKPDGEFKIVFYPIVPRDLEKTIRSVMEPLITGYISWDTAMEKMGFDPEEEKLKLIDEGRWPPWGAVGGADTGIDSAQSGTGGQQWRNPTKDIERGLMNRNIGAQTPNNP